MVRVTELQMFSSLVGNLQRARAKAFKLQEQLSTGKKVTKPSDDPSSFYSILSSKSSLDLIDQRLRNVQFGTGRLDLADRTLGNVTSGLARVRELAVQFRSNINGAAERSFGAAEVRQLLLEFQRLANTELNGHPVFGGTGTHGRATGRVITAPVTLTNGTNDTVTVTVDGVASGAIDLTAGSESLSGDALAARLQGRINADATLAAAGKTVTVTFEGDHLVVSSNGYGAGSSVVVSGGNGLAALGFNGGSSTTGDATYAVAASAQAASSNSGGAIAGQAIVRRADLATLDNYLIRFSSPGTFDVVNTSRPVNVTANAANQGKAGRTDGGVVDAAQVTIDSYSIQFTSDTQFQINNVTTGTVVSSGNTYVSGGAITFDGLRVVLTNGSGGGPRTGDQFSVSLDAKTVVANQSYISGTPISFDGVEVTLSNGSGAPVARDRFAVTTAIQYQGDAGLQRVEVADGETVPTNIPGGQIFNGPQVDLFAVVKNLEAALSGNDSEGIERSLGDLDRALNQVSVARGEIGALAGRLDVTASGLDESKGIISQILSEDEDADLAKTISELTLQQVALEAASQTVSRLFESSLLKFLR